MANLESLCKVRLSRMDDENALAFISNLRYIRRTNLTPARTSVKKSEVLVKAQRKTKTETKQQRMLKQASNLSAEQIAIIINRKGVSNG